MARRAGAGAELMALLLLLPLGALLAPVAAADTDRDALLAFKAGLSDPTGKLFPSWNDTVHYCRWPGVRCGTTTGRVTSLDVSEHDLTGNLSPAVGNLTQLRVLNLTDNIGVSGPIPASLGRLRRLWYLSLCGNAFTGEIPSAIRNCTSLGVAYFNKNHLTGGVPTWLHELRNLTVLGLGHNRLAGEIPPSLGNATTLQSLYLNENRLVGVIPPAVARLPDLRVFTVYDNNLTGEIPRGFFDMPSLEDFVLANNRFRGELPADAGKNWPNLARLLLGGNELSGPIPPSLAMAASSLVFLSLANNSFAGNVPPEIGSLCVESLELSNNMLTADGGWEFLEGLTGCDFLLEIHLDGNRFAGALPGSIIARLSPALQKLSLGGNSISGVIPPDIGNLQNLQTLDLRNNLLAGEIPEGIGKLKKLQELRLQNNMLTGPVPSSIGKLGQLLKLDLSGNSLNGSIPASLGDLTQLMMINLAGNMLSGRIPSSLFSMRSLSMKMDLSDNQLEGTLPPQVGQLRKVTILALAGNRLSGEVPAELGSCENLEFLDLDSNLFTGTIPASLSRLKGLRWLSLAGNRLTGPIPPQLGQMTGLQQLYLSRNDLSGAIPAGLENVSTLVDLDLSYNYLDGQVPKLGVFANNTGGFRMDGNTGALCGGAPQLDLQLPPCPTPTTTANSTTTGVQHDHIMFLKIGLPLTVLAALCIAIMLTCLFLQCRTRRRRSKIADIRARSVLNGNNYPRVSYADLAKATDNFAAANLVGSGKYGSVYRGILSLQAKGSCTREDVLVAVKVFDLQQVGASKTFVSECEALRSVRHRNLMSIVTCCSSINAEGNEFRALVLDFMPNSSLDRWLHPTLVDVTAGRVLSVVQRLSIAVDIADALSYLHDSCAPPIVHCDLKPSNVLLGEDMTACIADFGLAKLLLDPGTHGAAEASESTMGVRGTIGYIAPEYGTSGQVSTYGDVYSFGITLLEIFVGKAPTSDVFRDGLTLTEFVGAAFPDNLEQVLDPALLMEEQLFFRVTSPTEENGLCVTVYDCVVSAIRVALSCCRQEPCQRMSMRDAAAELCLIRDACVRAYGQ